MTDFLESLQTNKPFFMIQELLGNETPVGEHQC